MLDIGCGNTSVAPMVEVVRRSVQHRLSYSPDPSLPSSVPWPFHGDGPSQHDCGRSPLTDGRFTASRLHHGFTASDMLIASAAALYTTGSRTLHRHDDFYASRGTGGA